ncbi:hypothetical protein [Pelagovum pacificum]|uniref:Alpha/beta hydrolase n=1 Tax=Pelagovum pacificum TaxID=2588711 RepID=A0A5C5GCZ4_9RHOB|nr:hypothetical protein [Pelagovum pacificum]QQA41343.1 hypothetical protein I8N54_10925 [Pelagovum pacificum]TNY31851.1 hypothetical protein FHY64_00670 [Pelagovum pacificum]
MTAQSSRPVARRRVFYIPGYDPIHPRRYRELYRKEGSAQAAITGYDIALAPKRGGGPYGWHVTGRIDGAEVEADVEVLVWSDIVRGSMSSSIPATYLQLVRCAWTYITSGALRRLMWLRKGPVIAALYPVGMLILQLMIAVWTGVLLGYGAGELLGALGLPDALAVLAGLAVWGAVATLILRWFKKKDGKFFAYYLMHDYAYSANWKGANPPDLEARMAEFGDRIAEALADEFDEVLVVGHSSGAHLGVSILADLIRQGRVPANGPALAFLSLGQVVPMVSFLPKADRLRGDLAYLCTRKELTWVDVTAPGDGCAFALCDPVAVSGVAPVGQKWPLVFSAAFTQSLSPERWKEMRWRFFRLHFQYLCAFDRPKDYDYFQITAGPVTLADRYADRPHSKSRIDIPASKYTSIAA